MNRRQFLATTTAVSGTVLAGCGILEGEESFEHTAEITADITRPDASDAISEGGLRTFAGSMNERFGTAGVWGRNETAPETRLEHLGAKTDTRRMVGIDAVTHHTLSVYRVPGVTNDGDVLHQLWLWSGFDTTDSDAECRRIEIALDFNDSVSLGVYSPTQLWDSEEVDSYRVGIPGTEGNALGVEMPLSTGVVDIEETDSRIGSGGSYAGFWEGRRDNRQSLLATCEALWRPDHPFEFEWRVGGTFS